MRSRWGARVPLILADDLGRFALELGRFFRDLEMAEALPKPALPNQADGLTDGFGVHVDAMLKGVDGERDEALEMAEPPSAATNRIRRLVRLRGIGPQIATALATEVFYREFRSRRNLGSYLGLTPSPFQSGVMARDQGITKAGNPRARTTAIELAWLWLRYQPRSDLARWFHARTSGVCTKNLIPIDCTVESRNVIPR